MGIKLLFADDSETMRKVIKLTLENEGIDLSVVSDGQEAIKAVYEAKPDIVVADISMPEINGFELCARIKGSPETKDISVVLISGELENYDDVRGGSVGADGHLTKPFKSKEFVAAIKSFVEKKGTAEALPAEQVDESKATTAPFDSRKILTLTASQGVSPMAGQIMQTDDELEIIEDDIGLDDDLYEELDDDEMLITPNDVKDEPPGGFSSSVLSSGSMENEPLDNDEIVKDGSSALEDMLVDEISAETGFAPSNAHSLAYSFESEIKETLLDDDEIDSIVKEPLGSNPLLGRSSIESSGSADEYDVESLWDSLKDKHNAEEVTKAVDEAAHRKISTALDISGSVPVSEADAEPDSLRESVEESVKEFIEKQGKEVLEEIIAKSVEDNVKLVIERELERSIREEVAKLVGDSFEAAMPELIESVKGMISGLAPGMAAEIAKKTAGRIKKED